MMALGKFRITPAIIATLLPGDIFVYSGNSLFSKGIKLKTWSEFSHVETYLGPMSRSNGLWRPDPAGMPRTHASRDSGKLWGAPKPGTGVGTFLVPDRDDCVLIRRPYAPFDLVAALDYIDRVEGQRYDVWGIFRFFALGKQSTDKQFCSEDATRLARMAGIEPFSVRLDADLVSPRDFAMTASYVDIVTADDQTIVTANAR